ncbi:MAG: hypothetical protein RLZZ312_410 [Bacteroidota bacterium]|jgi:DNA polymerase-3 subunit delta'
MNFDDIIGNVNIKKHLEMSALSGRIPHAQLFIGSEGTGVLPMAIAYAKSILCNVTNDSSLATNSSCALKFKNLSHPDLHFIYPTVTTEDVKSKPKSIDFIADFRQFLFTNPYGSLFDWYKILDVKNKQGEIRVDDAEEIVRVLSLKSYEGGYKIVIIWMAEKINISASNKLLKLLEEPYEKTLFILIAEQEEDIIQTIRSRCQVLHFSKLTNIEIENALFAQKKIDLPSAQKTSRQAQGNYNKALQLLETDTENSFFEKWFIDWVRAAFRARQNAEAVLNLISWSENVAALGRETQKKFLEYCLDMFRQALLLNYKLSEMVYFEPIDEKFKLENLAPFVNGNNIDEIFKEISDAIYHIERNGNAKIVLTDLSIKLTRLLHKK